MKRETTALMTTGWRLRKSTESFPARRARKSRQSKSGQSTMEEDEMGRIPRGTRDRNGGGSQNLQRHERDEAAGPVGQPHEQTEWSSEVVHRDEPPRSDEPRDLEPSKERASNVEHTEPGEEQTTENEVNRVGSEAGSPESRPEREDSGELEMFREDVKNKYPAPEQDRHLEGVSIKEDGVSLGRGHPGNEKAQLMHSFEGKGESGNNQEGVGTATPRADSNEASLAVHESRDGRQDWSQQEKEGLIKSASQEPRKEGDPKPNVRAENELSSSFEGSGSRVEHENDRGLKQPRHVRDVSTARDENPRQGERTTDKTPQPSKNMHVTSERAGPAGSLEEVDTASPSIQGLAQENGSTRLSQMAFQSETVFLRDDKSRRSLRARNPNSKSLTPEVKQKGWSHLMGERNRKRKRRVDAKLPLQNRLSDSVMEKVETN